MTFLSKKLHHWLSSFSWFTMLLSPNEYRFLMTNKTTFHPPLSVLVSFKSRRCHHFKDAHVMHRHKINEKKGNFWLVLLTFYCRCACVCTVHLHTHTRTRMAPVSISIVFFRLEDVNRFVCNPCSLWEWAQRQQFDTLHSITMLSCLYLCNRWHLFPALPRSSTHSPFARKKGGLRGWNPEEKDVREKKICTVSRLRFRKLAL